MKAIGNGKLGHSFEDRPIIQRFYHRFSLHSVEGVSVEVGVSLTCSCRFGNFFDRLHVIIFGTNVGVCIIRPTPGVRSAGGFPI